MADEPLLLDTHVWLWMEEGADAEVSAACKEVIVEAAASGGLRVSALSVWEIAMLDAKGRIALSRECGAWVTTALAAPGVRLVPLDPAVAIASTRLPDGFRSDPVDQILVATSRVMGWPLVTRDRRILDYARRGHLRAIDASARRIRR
jgi:PIN domain nuclease of toxin-antitoxin system